MEMSLFPLSMFYCQCVDFVCVYSLMRFLSLSFLEIFYRTQSLLSRQI